MSVLFLKRSLNITAGAMLVKIVEMIMPPQISGAILNSSLKILANTNPKTRLGKMETETAMESLRSSLNRILLWTTVIKILKHPKIMKKPNPTKDVLAVKKENKMSEPDLKK